MARSPAKGGGSVAEATTLIFPKKTVWEELAKTKRETKKRGQSQAGIYGAAVKEAVEKNHVDRKALAIVLKLEAMEDDDLHVTMFHFIDGIKKLGILKRAMAQEEMFDADQIDGGALDAAEKALAKLPKTRAKKFPGASGDDLAKTTKPRKPKNGGLEPIGTAARTVAETAGGDEYKSTH